MQLSEKILPFTQNPKPEKPYLEDFSSLSYNHGTKSTYVEKEKPESEDPGISLIVDELIPSTLVNSGFSSKPGFAMNEEISQYSENKSQRFIKFFPSDKILWLLKNYPLAHSLLTIIAIRARRTSSQIDGLEIGECYIGDWKSCGLTRQQYRTSLKYLMQLKIIKISETCRNRKKSTTGSTTIGTKVKLIDSSIYDINPETNNQQANHRPTTDQPPTNHEEECKEGKEEKEKRKKKKKPDKPAYAPSAHAEELLNFFISSLKIHIPEVPEPEKLLTSDNICSVRSFDQLLKNYSPEEIRKVITFSHTHRFWSQLVHKPSYLKSKFSSLLAAYRREVAPPSYTPKVDRRTLNKDGTPMHSPFEDKF